MDDQAIDKQVMKEPTNNEPKVALFVGLTQNGKSSLIRSILKYAGDELQAEKVTIGYDSLSTTKEALRYDVKIPRKEHFLQYKDEKESPRQVKIDKDLEDIDFDDVEEQEVSLHRISFLRLLDSPGLSDSKKEPPGSGEEVEEVAPRVEDEKHKLKVLQALTQESRLNAVCFVVRKGAQFGKDFQKHIKAYAKILEINGLMETVGIHVLHTQIDVEDRFRDIQTDVRDRFPKEKDERSKTTLPWMTARTDSFLEVTGVHATHHWLDNAPDRRNPIDQYFSKAAIARLVACLATSSSTSCQGLIYPKDETMHKIYDNQLRRAYESLIHGLETEKKSLEAELHAVPLGPKEVIRKKTACVEAFKAQIEILTREKIVPLDTDDPEVVGGDANQKYKSTAFDNWSPTVNFSYSTDAPIKWVVRNPELPTNGKWKLYQSTEKYYHADYQANLWCDARASVVLKGERRDLHAVDIAKYKKQREEFEEDVKKIQIEMEPAEAEIREKSVRIEAIQVEIKSLQKDMSCLDIAGIPLAWFQGKEDLFFARSVYSIARGYKIESQVSKKHLPKHIFYPEEINTELLAEQRIQRRMMSAVETLLNLFKEDLSQKSAVLEFGHLKRLHDELLESITTIEERMDGNVAFRGSEDVSTGGEFPFRDQIFEEAQQRGDICQALLEEIFTKSGVRISLMEQAIRELLEKARSMVEEAEKMCQEYTKMYYEHRARSYAILGTLEDLRRETLFVGSFVVLSKAISEKKPSPYMSLYHERFAENFILAQD